MDWVDKLYAPITETENFGTGDKNANKDRKNIQDGIYKLLFMSPTSQGQEVQDIRRAI